MEEIKLTAGHIEIMLFIDMEEIELTGGYIVIMLLIEIAK